MTSWRDNLRDASFRDVPFYVESAESEIGRRTVVHEFPGQDLPVVDDLGGRAGRYRLEAFVVGDDYMAARAELHKAFTQPGDGALIHPYWGEMTVSTNGPIVIKESNKEGGMARLTVPLVRTAAAEVPVTKPATAEEVRAKVDVALRKSAEAFEDTFTVAGFLSGVKNGALAALNTATAAIRSATGVASSIVSSVEDIVAAIDRVKDALADLADTPRKLAEQLQTLAGQVLGSVSSLIETVTSAAEDLSGLLGSETADLAEELATEAEEDLAEDPGLGVDLILKTHRELLGAGSDLAPVPETTPQRVQEAANQRAVVHLTKTAGALETCRAVTYARFDSIAQATAARDELAGDLTTLAEDAEDGVFAALLDVRAALIQHFDLTAPSLARVVEYTPQATLPALLLAHQIYGDARRAEEIVRRNDIPHPGFVAGGETLKVLSDAVG